MTRTSWGAAALLVGATTTAQAGALDRAFPLGCLDVAALGHWAAKGPFRAVDPAARDAALGRLHAAGVDEALFIWFAHDVSPRAMSPRVKGFVQPQSWFVDVKLPYIQ